MTVEELHYSEDISFRAYNICIANGLNNISQILIYYLENETFENIKNCGKKSNNELKELCLEYINQNYKINNLTITQNKIVNTVIKLNENKLTNKSKNALTKFLNGDLNFNNLSLNILNKRHFKIQKIKNIDSTSRNELKDFIRIIKLNVQIISIIHNKNKLINIQNEIIKEKDFPVNKNAIQLYGLNNKDINDLCIQLKYNCENKSLKNERRYGERLNVEPSAISLPNITQHYKICNLTRVQREIINGFIEINSNYLTKRSKNALKTYLNGNIKIRNFSERILTNEVFLIKDIKNIGEKSTSELKGFIHLIENFVENVLNTTDEKELIPIKNRIFIEKNFSISQIPSEILDSQSIFKITDFLLNSNAIFEKDQNLIFEMTFKIYRRQPELNLDQIAEELQLSKERVRQIRKGILRVLFARLKNIKKVEDDLFQKYKIDISQNVIFIESDLTAFINQRNDTDFSNEFISYLIYVYISDNFSLIGRPEDVLFPKLFNHNERHKWEKFYLVDKKICTVFLFNEFADDIDKRLNERVEETYTFNFKGYLSNFFTDTNLNLLEEVTEVTEQIINNEFGIYLDLEDNIVFPRNSWKQAYEYAYEALKQLGKPAKVTEITSMILQLHPNYNTDNAKVRTSMKRKDGFVPVGRRSIFGLKEWENELENFKGGTIREIVFEYLENHMEPKHISTITSYVLKFRPKSNQYSILQNLKVDKSKSFLFFKNSFVGLSGKNYDKSYILVINENTVKTKTWEERHSDLIKFLNQNDRLPFSSGCPANEIKLYRWYKIQLGKSKKEDLNYEKTLLIKEIYNKYEQK